MTFWSRFFSETERIRDQNEVRRVDWGMMRR
jgi:hypothetical protein